MINRPGCKAWMWIGTGLRSIGRAIFSFKLILDMMMHIGCETISIDGEGMASVRVSSK